MVPMCTPLDGKATDGQVENLAELTRLAADRWPDREALVHGSRRHTFAEVGRLVAQQATHLQGRGVVAGDMVVTISRNSDIQLISYFALAALGAVNVALSPMATRDDVVEAIERTSAKTLLYDATLEQIEADEIPDVAAVPLEIPPAPGDGLFDLRQTVGGGDNPAMVIFTSGSLSRPKACIKTHRNLIWHGINRQMSGPIEPGGRELYCVPLSGIGFGNYIVSHFLSGTTIVIEPFEARATLATIQDERITYVFLPPTMLYAMLKVPDQLSFDLSSLERMPIGYELPQRMRLQLVDRFGPIFEYGYGSTEGTCSYATPNEFLEDPLCVGLVAGLDEVRVVDEKGLELPEGETGEIIARGPTVTPGYLGDPELTAQTLRDGWYHTGDLGWFGPGKYLHFAGRIKDIIKSGGMNVSAAEVEDVFADYPGVEQVSVVGVPDERWSEAVVAAIVPSEGAVLDQEELAAFAGAQLTGYKRPKRYVLLDELPRNPAGKVAKPKLRAMLTDEGVDGAPVPRAGASG